jgi:glycosyltransferase involved in cell wall biosynthesis
MTTPKPPLISVITATYNMGLYLEKTLASILAQTHESIEAIVVDDGSTDEATSQVLDKYRDDPRVKVIRQQNAGQTVAKNRGLQEVTGDFVAFCDADDLWRPEKIATQLPLFDDAGRIGVVYSDFQFIDEHDTPIDTVRPRTWSGRITGKLLADNFIHFPTALVRRDVIDEFNGFNENLSMAIDYDLWLRISTGYEFLYIPQILVDYRIWSGQMSHRTGERLDNAFRMMESFLDQYPQSVSGSEKRHAWAHTYVTRGLWHVREGRPAEARADFVRAFQERPWDIRLWKTLVKWGLNRPVC